MNQISLPCTAPFHFCFGCALRLLNTLTALKAVNISIANISSEIWVSAIITAIRRARHTWKAYKTCFANICLGSFQLMCKPEYAIPKINMLHNLSCCERGSGCCAVDIYCTAALTLFSDSTRYITYLFSEWHIYFNF